MSRKQLDWFNFTVSTFVTCISLLFIAQGATDWDLNTLVIKSASAVQNLDLPSHAKTFAITLETTFSANVESVRTHLSEFSLIDARPVVLASREVADEAASDLRLNSGSDAGIRSGFAAAYGVGSGLGFGFGREVVRTELLVIEPKLYPWEIALMNQEVACLDNGNIDIAVASAVALQVASKQGQPNTCSAEEMSRLIETSERQQTLASYSALNAIIRGY